MEVDAVNEVPKMYNYGNNKKDNKNYVSSVKTYVVNNEVANYEINNSVDIDDESEGGRNDTREVNTDESDEETKVETGNV